MDTFTGTAILFALDREAAPFLKHFPDRIRGLGGWRCDGGRLLIACVGVGSTMAREWVEQFLAAGHRPKRLMIAGFAGALVPELSIGDVVVVEEVINSDGLRWPAAWPADRAGRLLTSDRMIVDPAEKAALGLRHDATVVDMESAAVAEVCQRHGIPFTCVRVVSDEMNHALSPRLLKIIGSGQVSILRVLGELVRSPRLLSELLRLAKHTRLAAKRLADVLIRLCDAGVGNLDAGRPNSDDSGESG